MEKVIVYKLVRAKKTWQFTFRYKEEASWLEIPSDMRGYFARHKEQYDWLKNGLVELNLIAKLQEAWSSVWKGELVTIEQIEQWLQKQGAEVLPFS